MIDKKILNFCLAIAVLLISFALINYFLIMPALSLKLPNIALLPSEQGSSAFFDTDIAATTLEKIKSMQTESDKLLQNSVIARNPFLWPEEKIGGEPEIIEVEIEEIVERKIEKKKNYKVSMIIIGEERNLAIIDGVFVSTGSRFDGKIVQRIEKNAVILKGKNGEIRAPISNFSFSYLYNKFSYKVKV